MDSTRNLQRLLTWLSPAFPVGAFAWSGGLEASGLEPDELEGWLRTSLQQGPLWNDAVLCAAAHRGEDVDDLAIALAGSRLRRDETTSLGEGFAAAHAAWGTIEARAYPVAVGRATRAMALRDVLAAFLQSGIVNLVQCAQRTMPLGQSRAMALLAALEPVIAETAERAAASGIDDLGGCAFGIDMAVMRHETLPSRIFRS